MKKNSKEGKPDSMFEELVRLLKWGLNKWKDKYPETRPTKSELQAIFELVVEEAYAQPYPELVDCLKKLKKNW